MKMQLHREIDKLKKSILELSAKVENDVRLAVRAADDYNAELADEVISRENVTNNMEVDIEEECLKILALYQPVAGDLRYIIAVLKINQDLERIGDLAVHIAERALFLCKQPKLGIPIKLDIMASRAQGMLKKVLDAFVNNDESAARQVFEEDIEVNKVHKEIFHLVKESIMAKPDTYESMLQILNISRHLERIADHVTNIAEDLIYLVEGRIVRHKH